MINHEWMFWLFRLTSSMKIISKSVRIIKCNNLLCQVNVSCQFHNQFKDNQYNNIKCSEIKRRDANPTLKYMMLRVLVTLSIMGQLELQKEPEPFAAFHYIDWTSFTWKHLLAMGIYIQSWHLLGVWDHLSRDHLPLCISYL